MVIIYKINKVRRDINQLKQLPKIEKLLKFTGMLTRLLTCHKLYPILIGAPAVQVSNKSKVSAVDIDLIYSDRQFATEVLLRLGFEKEGRQWHHYESSINIELHNDFLDTADYEKVVHLELFDGNSVYVIRMEDII